MVGGLLVIMGINDNNITSGIPNCIPSPSNLWYVVNKYREDKYIKIPGVFCNYPCIMSCDKVERDGLGRMFKDIAFWGVE